MGRFLCCLERSGPALCFDSASREQRRVGLPRSKLDSQIPQIPASNLCNLWITIASASKNLVES
jgi:hypothetical protein